MSVVEQAVPTRPTAPRDLSTLAGLVGSYLDEQLEAITRGEAILPDDADAVHATRVATRRYRSVLRVLRPAFRAGTAHRLDRELAWFAAALGDVRDRQVLRTYLDEVLADAAAEPQEFPVAPARDRIHATLDAELANATAQLRILLRSERYAGLMAQLRDWRGEVPLAPDIPAADVATYVSRAERDVARRERAVPADDGRDEVLHAVRKATKRARYLAELSRPELGERARSTAVRYEDEQTRLGRHQDAVVAVGFLARISADAAAAGEETPAYSMLSARALARSPGGLSNPPTE